MRSGFTRQQSPDARARCARSAAFIEPLEPRTLLAVAPLPAGTPPIVRVAYIIPSDRDPQPGAIANLQYSISTLQDWYRDQMQRSGFGAKTFLYETEADGITPKIHTLEVPDTDDYLRGDIWPRVNAAASAAGVPLFAQGQVWLLVPEIHTQTPDGDITGGVALGASNGSGRDGGVAQIGTNALAFLNDASLRDTRSYNGLTVTGVGPYRLVQNVSFASFEGTTVSQLASTYLGAMLHELTHGFGLPHDFRNDANFDGNLMGNGFRGLRGALLPDSFPGDAAYLQYGQALMLNTSRYFNRSAAPESTGPTLSGAAASFVNGSVRISFNAADASGLSSVLLLRNGDQVAELPLAGTSVNGAAISTPYYDAGVAQTFKLMIYDVHGNRRMQDVVYTPPTGANRAPKPFIDAASVVARMGENVSITSTTTDPDGGVLTYEWDTDGDGTFDTPPGSSPTLTVGYASPGTRLVRLRVTDPLGASAVSAPLSVKVLPSIRGTAASDTWYVRKDPSDLRRVQVFKGNDTSSPPAFTFPVTVDAPVTIQTLGGNDRVTLDFAYGSMVPAAGFVLDGGGNTDTLTVRGGASLGAVLRPSSDGTTGVLTIAGREIDLTRLEVADFRDLASLTYVTPAADDSLAIQDFGIPRITGTSGGIPIISTGFWNVPVVTIDAASNDLAGGTGYDQLSVFANLALSGLETLRLDTGDGPEPDGLSLSQGAVVPLHALRDDVIVVSAAPSSVLTLTRAQHLRSLTLGDGARAALAFEEGDLRLGGLTLVGRATLDVADRSILVATTPENRDALLAHIVGRVRTARESTPAWSGPGITSSHARENPASGIAAYSRHPEEPDILIDFTYNGDTNSDGRVNADDYFRIDGGFLAQPANPGYRDGDFNYDGRINADDYFLIDSAFLGQSQPLALDRSFSVIRPRRAYLFPRPLGGQAPPRAPRHLVQHRTLDPELTLRAPGGVWGTQNPAASSATIFRLWPLCPTAPPANRTARH